MFIAGAIDLVEIFGRHTHTQALHTNTHTHTFPLAPSLNLAQFHPPTLSSSPLRMVLGPVSALLEVQFSTSSSSSLALLLPRPPTPALPPSVTNSPSPTHSPPPPSLPLSLPESSRSSAVVHPTPGLEVRNSSPVGGNVRLFSVLGMLVNPSALRGIKGNSTLASRDRLGNLLPPPSLPPSLPLLPFPLPPSLPPFPSSYLPLLPFPLPPSLLLLSHSLPPGVSASRDCSGHLPQFQVLPGAERWPDAVRDGPGRQGLPQ